MIRDFPRILPLAAPLAALALLGPGCGAGDDPPSESAATPTPAPTVDAHAAEEEAAEHAFEPGHSKAVREYYGEPHHHDDTAAGDTEAEYHQPPHPAAARLGGAITLTGVNLGIRMKVKVTGVSTVAARGTRYLAVRVRLHNTGIAIYESALDHAVVTYAGGRRERAVTGVDASCSNGFQGLLRIDVGDRAAGCLLFKRPGAKRPRWLQLALEYVPAAVGGRWTLG